MLQLALCCDLQEDQERTELEQRLERMVATTAWLNPQPNEDLSDAKLAAMPAPPAYGEDSTEAPAAAARMQQVRRAWSCERTHGSRAMMPRCRMLAHT